MKLSMPDGTGMDEWGADRTGGVGVRDPGRVVTAGRDYALSPSGLKSA